MVRLLSPEQLIPGQLPPIIFHALEEYFQDLSSLTDSGIIFWEAHPKDVLQYYWEHLKGAVIAFKKPDVQHPCLEYVLFLNEPCHFKDIYSALQRKSKYSLWKIGPYLADFQMRRLMDPNTMQVIDLTEKESKILEYLLKSVNKSIDRESLLQKIWKYSADITTHTLETHIYRLRQKLAPNENLLLTTETGYMLLG